MLFTRLGITPPKVNRSEVLWVHSPGLAVADFGRDPRSSESWRVRRNFVFLSDKQRTILLIFRRPNFRKFEHNTSTDVATKPQKFEFFNALWLQVAITSQWLWLDENLLSTDPSKGSLFPFLPLESIQSHSPCVSLRFFAPQGRHVAPMGWNLASVHSSNFTPAVQR